MIQASRLAAAAGALMRAREVRLFHDHLLVKEAGTRDRSPWHQDQPYYCIDGSQTVSFWIPLDPVARPSTLEFVAGSHAEGRWFMPRSFVKGTPMVFEDGALAEVPDIEADRERVGHHGLGARARRRGGVQHAHAARRGGLARRGGGRSRCA